MEIEISRKDKKLFNAIGFLKKAIDNKHPKQSHKCIKISGNQIASTNGHRLHIAETTVDLGIESGVYSLALDKEGYILTKENIKFPNYYDLFEHSYIDCNIKINYEEKPVSGIFVSMILFDLAKHNIKINSDYVKTLFDKNKKWKISFIDSKRPVLFESENGKIAYKALIVPFNGGK